MSSIQANSVVVRGLLALRRDPAKSENSSPKRPADQAMTHAWSIGTTRAAQQMAAPGEKSPSREGECPPEVYIG